MTPPIAAALESAIATFIPRTQSAPRAVPPRAPNHVAAVLDETAASALHALIDGALQQGVANLSLDVSACVPGATAFLNDAGSGFVERGVMFRALTNTEPSAADAELLQTIQTLASTKTETPRLKVVLAVAYDTKQDLSNAALFVKKNDAGCAERDFQKHMAAGDLPSIDVFLYTGGSARLSSFLLWHAAYAELCFSQTPWNVFGAGDVRAMVNDYAARSRTFGALKK